MASVLWLQACTSHFISIAFHSIVWQDYLKSYEKTIIIVSHDRVFLNEVGASIEAFNNIYYI